MPTYHRSQRLKLVGAGPRVEQLQNDRYRLTFQCEATNPREAWMFGNKSQIFASYGTLSTAQMSIAGIDRRTNEAYTDAVLVATEATPTEDNMIVTLVYETLGTSFVQVKDDTIDFDLNGLQRVTRESIAKVGTSFSKSIGGTAITVDGVNCVLASLNVDNTDSYVKLIEVYLEEGTVLETIDNVGSQKAKAIETFGTDPSTPAGYSIARKEESNFQGYQTNRFTFLKDNVELSRVNDFVGSQLAITRTFYNPTSDPTESGYTVARKEQTDFEGIETIQYTFLKDGVTLSTSEDKVGSQLAVVKEVFNGTPSTPSGYVIAREETSEVDGIPTKRFTFLEPSVLQSEELFQISQNRVRVTAFDLTESEAKTVVGGLTNHYLLSTSTSDFEGIETFVYTFDKSSITRVSRVNIGAYSNLEVYEFISENESPATLHAASALTLPDGTTLNANATFLEATKDSSSKPDTFSQIALNTSSTFNGSTPLLVHQYDTFIPFTYPGVAGTSTITELSGSYREGNIALDLEGPVQTEVQATVFEFLQSDSNLVSSDYTHDSSRALWAPNQWASVRVEAFNPEATNVNRNNTHLETLDLRGYRLAPNFGDSISNVDLVRFNNNNCVKQFNDKSRITVSGVDFGPEDPVGNKYVLDLSLEPFTSLADGTTIYKKTIIVSDTIPTQAGLGYS